MAGGYTSDPKVCGFSQVYVSLIDQITGQTIWNRSLNTAIVKILAIKFNLFPSTSPDAVIVVLFPQNMQFARVSQAGQVTSSIKLSTWTKNGVYTQLTSSAAVVTDTSYNVYMGTYENPTNRFIVYKINPYKSSFTATLIWDIYLPNGSCTCVTLSQDQQVLYVGGHVNNRAYVGALDNESNSKWYFQRVSTSQTISEKLTLLKLFKDTSELYWRLFASIEEFDANTAQYTLIFMNMWLTSATNPQTPTLLRSRAVSSQYQYLDLKNASKDLTIVFIQNLGDFTADLLLLNWSTQTMVQRDFNYGPSEIWFVSAAILFPSATDDQTVYFGGYTNSIWGARSCSASSNAFYQMTVPGQSISTGFGFINVIGPNQRSCARPTVKEEVITLSPAPTNYLGKSTSPPTWTKAGCTCTEQNGAYMNPNSACLPYTTFKTTFCQSVKSLCSGLMTPPTIQSNPIPNQTWSTTSNFQYTFNYWTYGGTICGQACSGNAIFYELKVEFGGNVLTTHPFFLSGNNIYGNASFTGLPATGIYKITLIGNLVDLSSCYAQTFQVSVQGSCIENIQQLTAPTMTYQYLLGEPAINIPFPTIVMNPDCGNGETFELFFEFSASQYPIVDLTTQQNNWTFFTNNNAFNGQTLQLMMVVTPLGSNTGPQQIYYTVFINPCKYATCVVSDNVTLVNVYPSSAPQDFQVFASSIPNCSMSFTLQKSDSSPYPPGLIPSFSNTTGHFTVFASDYLTWSGTETNMKLTCVPSQAQVQTPTTIPFKIICNIDDDGNQTETCYGPQWVLPEQTIDYTVNSGVISQDLWAWLLQANTPNCPIQLSLSNTNPKISLNSSTGIFSINPQSDRSLDGQTLVVYLLAYSPATFWTDTMTLTVKFRSDCRDLVISQNPAFQQTSYSTNLYQNLEMHFNWPSISIPSCINDFTTVLWNTNTNAVSTLFNFQNLPISPFFSKTPTTNVPWVTLSPQSFKVRMTNNLGLTIESSPVPVTVFDPCLSTSFISQTLNNMQFTIGQSTAVTQTIQVFNDQVSVTYSSQYGNGSQHDLCGPQTYQLKNLSSGVTCPCSFSQLTGSNQISLNTSSSSDVGNKNMALIVQLTNYPSISLQLPFIMQINSCQITSISVQQPQTTTINYNIQSPLQNLNVGLPQVTKVPSTCDQPLSIVIIDKNTGLPLPFVTIVNGDIIISTDDPNYSGTYNIQLVISAPGQPATPVTVDYVLVCSPCLQDVITVTQSIADFNYYLQSGVKPLNAAFTSKYPQYCPLQYTLKDSTGAAYDNQVFTAGQSSWSMMTNNQALAGTTFNMVITAYSGVPGPSVPKKTVSFKVTIQLGTSTGEPCTFQLVAPVIMNPLQIHYFEQFSYSFNGNLAIEPTCGLVSVKLLKQSTMVQIDPTQISLDVTDPNNPKIKASNLNSSSPIVATNPLKAVIQVTQGTGSILSNVFDIQFIDPCTSTVITPQTILSLSATPGQNIVSSSFQTFTDSASLQYGSGSGLCGPQSYKIYEVINGINVPVTYVYLTNGQKVINLDPNQNAAFGDHTFVLITTLDNYAISSTETFTCKIETCQITAMQVGQQTQTAYTYNIQQVPASLTINLPAVSFTPSTCPSSVSVQILFQSNSSPVPFATVLTNNSGFKISSNNFTYSGIYHIWAVLTPTAPNTVQPVKLPYTITITACGLHDFSTIYTTSDITSTLGQMNVVEPDLSWWQQSYCTLHFSLKVDNSSNINTALFNWNTSTGLLQIYTDDPNQNGKKYQLSIKVNDDASNTYTWNFSVTFIDNAASASLNQPDYQAVLNHILFSQDIIINAGNQVVPAQAKIQMTYTISSVPQQALSPFIMAGTDVNGNPQYNIKVTTHNLMTVNNGQFFFTFTTLLVNKLYPLFVYASITSNIQINLVDPCFQTLITSQAINFPPSIVRGTEIVQLPFNAFIDSVSIQNSDNYGNGSKSDICVPQTYQVFELDELNNQMAEPYLTLQGTTIKFDPIQTLGYGIHKFVLVVTYAKYGIVHKENFQTAITQCQLSSMMLVSPATSSFSYNIQNPAVPLNIPIPQVIVSPQDCDQTINFQIIDTATGLPLGIVSIVGGEIVVTTSDPLKKGVYNLELHAVPSGQTTVQTQKWPFVLTLKPCKLDQASVVQTISNFTYLTNQGSKELVGTFSNLYPQECPLNFQLLRKGTSSYDIAIFQFTSSTGKLFINTSDRSLGGSSRTMQLIAMPTGSTQSAMIEFTVNFVDHCTQVTLSAPSANSPLSISFYQNFAVGFTQSTSSDPACGMLTYKILDSDGNPVSSDLMWMDVTDPVNPKLKALILPNSDTSKLNTIKIQAIQGSSQTTATLSSPIQVLFVDPCLSTVINPQTILPLSAIQNAQIATESFQVFKDTVSLQYTNQYGDGSGSDLCGPQSYKIYEVINGVNVPVTYVYLTNGQKLINLDPTQNTSIGDHQFVLITTLDKYGISHSEPFTVNLSSCKITSITAGSTYTSAYDYYVTIPAAQSVTALLPTPITLLPSTCPSDISLSIQFQSDGSPVPFATANPDKKGFTISTTSQLYGGTYNLWAIVAPTAPSTVQPLKIPFKVTIYLCTTDQVSESSVALPTTYTIGSTQAVPLPPLFTHQTSTCQLVYSVSNAAFIFTYDSQTKTVSIYSNNLTLNGQTLSINLVATSTSSGSQKTRVLSITLVDPCASSVIQPWTPFSGTLFPQNIFSSYNIPFTLASSSNTSCGSLQYSLLPGNPSAQSILSSFYLQSSAVKGLLTSRAFSTAVTNGIYDLKIKAELIGLQNVVYNTKEVAFQIKAVDPCQFTSFTTQSLQYPSDVVQGSQTVQISFNPFVDSVSSQFSSQYGNGSNYDICAPQVYNLYEVISSTNTVVSYLTFSQQNMMVIQFNPNSSVTIGLHQFKLKVSSAQYPTISTTVSFQINVIQCQLQNIQLGTLQNNQLVYEITQPTLNVMNVPLPTVTITPSTCNQALIWQIADQQTGNGYPFISIVNGQIKISSNNAADRGIYQLLLKVMPDGTSPAGPQQIPFQLIISPCKLDIITLQTAIQSFTYIMNSGLVTKSVVFTNLYPIMCPMTFTFTDPSGLIGWNGSQEINVLKTDRTLHGQVANVQLIANSQYATKSTSFSVTFQDDCANVVLTAPTLQSSVTVPYYSPTTVTVVPGQTTKSTCGPTSYKVIDAATGLEVSSNLIWIEMVNGSPIIKFNIKPTDSVPANIKVKFIQGPDEIGLMKEVLSSSMAVNTTNPCLTTVINSQLITAMGATENQAPPSTQTFQIFKDSVSVQFGNGSGYDLCGPQTYQVLEIISNARIQTFAYITTSGALKINVDPLIQGASTGVHNFVLITTLTDYNIKHEEFFAAHIDQCVVSGLQVGIPSQTLFNYQILPNPQQLVITLPSITMIPSNCPSGIFIGLTDSNGQTPSFATISQNPVPKIIVSTSNTSLYGNQIIYVLIQPSGPNTVQPKTLQYTIQIDRCYMNTVSLVNNYTYLYYNFGQGPLPLSVFASAMSECPVAYSINVNGVSSYNTNVFSFNSLTGDLTVNTANTSLSPKIYSIDIFAQTQSGTVTESFTITFQDVCDAATLTDGNPWTSTQPVFQLYVSFNYQMKPATFTGPVQCGPPLYKILDPTTLVEVPASIIKVINQSSGYPKFQGIYTTRDMTKWDTQSQRYIYPYILKVYLGATTQYSFLNVAINIFVSEPCLTTVVNSQQIAAQPLEIILGGTNLNIVFQPFTDTVSFMYGAGNGYDICSPQTLLIKTLQGGNWVKPNWADVTPYQITINNSLISPGGVQTYYMRLNVTPLFAPQPHYEYFTLNVILCKINTLSVANPIPNVYTYDIKLPANAFNIPLPFISVVPNTCTNGYLGNGLDYKLVVHGSNVQPPFLSKGTDKFILNTSDPTQRGTWSIDLIIYPNALDSSAQPITKQYTLILSACQLANAAFASTITSINYTIGSGSMTFDPIFSSLYPVDCVQSLTLTQSAFATGNYDGLIVSQFNSATGLVTFNSTKQSLKGTSVVFIIRATQNQTGNFIEFQLTVNFPDQCQGVVLTKPVWQDTNDSYYLWVQGKLFFNKATASIQNCGTGLWTYKLIDSNTLIEIDPSVYTVYQNAAVPYVIATPPSRNPWLVNQPLHFALKATYGIYGSVTSNPLTVPILDPCFTTIIVPQTVLQITTQANNGQIKTRQFDPFFDTISQLHSVQFGNGSLYDLCGYNQNYSVSELNGNGAKQPTNLVYLSAGIRQLNVRQTTLADAGQHNMVLTVSLPDFGVTWDQPFLVLISDCQVTSMTIQQPSSNVINYPIMQPGVQKFIPYPTVTISPTTCQQGFLDTLVESGKMTKPSFVTLGATGFSILTSDLTLPSSQAVYNLELKITPDGPNTTGSQSIVYVLTLQRCQYDQISIATLIAGFNYYIGTGPIVKNGSFSNLYAECTYTLSLSEQTNTNFSLNMFSVNQAQGQFTVQTSDILLSNKSLNLKFTAQSTSSTNSATHFFDVTFKDPCYNTITDMPQFMQPSVNVELWSPQSVYFSMPKSSLNCGPFTLIVIDSQGNAMPTDSFVIDLSQPNYPKVVVTLKTTQWLLNSPIQIAIKAQLGPYKTINSPLLQINVINPCLSTVLQQQNIINMSTIINDVAPVTQNYQVFLDSVSMAHSQQYGNGLGFGMCGPQVVQLLQKNPNDGNYSPASIATLQTLNRQIIAGVFTNNNNQGLYDLRLRINLSNFPLVVLNQDFRLSIGSCTVTQMFVVTPSVTNFTYNINSGSLTNLIIPYPSATFQPTSCNAEAVYSVKVNGSTVNPSFMFLQPTGIMISTNNPSLSGNNYAIEVTVKPSGSNTVTPVLVNYNLTISACKIDQVTLITDVPDQNYVLGSGVLVLKPKFQSLYNCPLSYSMINDLQSNPVTASIDNTTGYVSISATNIILDGQVFSFDVKALSLGSGDDYVISFVITMIDICRQVNIVAPTFSVTQANQAIWTEEKYYFQKAQVQTQDCGTIQYRLLEAASLIQFQSTAWSIDLQQVIPSVGFFPITRQPWVQTQFVEVVIEAKLGSYLTVYSNHLKIVIIDPCLTTILNSQFISQMTASSSDTTTVSKHLNFFTDSVSSIYSVQFGNGSKHDLCGAQTYDLYKTSDNSKPSWLSLRLDTNGSPIIDLKPNLLPLNSSGYYEFTLKVKLTDYSEFQLQQFSVLISDCVITQFTIQADPNRDFTYDVGSTAINVPYPTATFVPNYCLYDISYSVVLAGTNTVPTFIQLSPVNDHFSIYTTNTSKIGDYIVELRIKPTGPNTVGQLTVTYTIEITGCIINTISKTSQITDKTYLIGSTPLPINGLFESLYASCQIKYSFTVATIGFYNPASITFDVNSPVLTINYQNTDMVGTVLNISFVAKSVVSQNAATQNFKVTFLSGCENINLLAGPIVMATSYSFDLWQAVTIPFTAAAKSATNSACGSIAYSLVRQDTLAQVLPSVFTVQTPILGGPKVTGMVTDRTQAALFPMTVQIKAKYGPDTLYSNPFVLTIKDICLTTVLQTHALNNMVTTILRGNPEEQTFTPFLDSVSINKAQYGNGSGYDLCGAQSYQVFEVISGGNVAVTHTTLVSNKISVLTTIPTDEGVHSMLLVVTMNDYPTIKLSKPFTVTINKCSVVSLTNQSTVPETNYKIGMPMLQITMPSYIQVPACGNSISYTMTSNGVALLPIMTFNTSVNPPTLQVFTTQTAYINDYVMQLVAKVIDPVTLVIKAQNTLSFKLHLLAEDTYCLADVPSLVTGPAQTSYTYYFDQPKITISGTFTHSLIYCEGLYQLTQTAGGNQSYLTGQYDTNLFGFDGTSGSFTVFADSSQNQYDKQTFTMTMSMKGVVSLNIASYTVQITVKNKCWDATITKASFSQTSVALDFRATNEITFNPATSSNPSCQNYLTYDFVITNIQPPGAIFTYVFSAPNKLVLTSQAPVKFDIQVKTGGQFVSGVNLISNPLSVDLGDRCSFSTLDGPSTLGQIVASELGPSVSKPYQLPVANLATVLGIPDVCGPVSQVLVYTSDPTIVFDWISLDINALNVLVQNTQTGSKGNYQFNLISTLVLYPNVQKNQSLNVLIQACVMTQFDISNTFGDIDYNLGQVTVQQTLQSFEMQPKCGYNISYKANVVSSANVLVQLPASMQFLNESVFDVYTVDLSQLGDYVVQITGTVTEGPQTGSKANFRFMVHILPPDILSFQNNPPRFVSELPPIIQTVAKTGVFALNLTLPQATDPENDNISLIINFGDLQGYIVFNSVTRKFEIASSFTAEQVPLGLHLLLIELKDDNPTGSLSNFYQIGIDIQPPEITPDGNGGNQTTYNATAPIIADISNTGLVSLLFNDTDQYNQMLNVYNQQQQPQRRLLQDTVTLLYNTDVSPFQVSLQPGPEAKTSKLAYTWKIVSTDPKTGKMDVQMDFTQPEYVSSNIDYDKFAFAVIDPKFYQNPNGNLDTAKKSVVGDIIRQIDGKTDAALVIKRTTLVITIIVICLGIIIFISFLALTNGDDPYLWNFFDTLQLLTHIQLMNVKLPGNAALFMNVISPIFRFDFIADSWVNKAFRLPFNPSSLPVFQQVGYTQTYMLTNTVTLWVIFGGMIFMWCIFFAYEQFKKARNKGKVDQIEQKGVKGKLKHQLFVGMPIRLLLLLYLVFCVTSVHNLIALRSDFSSVVAIISLVALIGCLAYVTNKYFANLNATIKGKRQQFGWLARVINLERGRSRALLFPIFFLARRLLLALVFVFLYQLYAAQVVIWLLLSLGMMFTISGIKPFKGKWLNIVNLINEFFVFFAGVMMLPLSNILEDLDQRDKVGIALIILILICIAFNIIILLLRSFYLFKDACWKNKELVTNLIQKHIQVEVEPEANKRENRTQPTKTDLIEIDERDEDSLMFPQKQKVKIPKDFDYDADGQEVGIKIKKSDRKKPMSFLVPQPNDDNQRNAQTMRNADNKRINRGVNMATSMDGLPELQFEFHNHKNDNQSKKLTQSVVERPPPSKRGDNDDGMLRRNARMALPVEDGFACKVEIVPINNRRDHYYILTKEGVQIAEIMPPQTSSEEGVSPSTNDDIHIRGLGRRDNNDKKDGPRGQPQNQTPFRLGHYSLGSNSIVLQDDKSSDHKTNPLKSDNGSFMFQNGSILTPNPGNRSDSLDTTIREGTEENSYSNSEKSSPANQVQKNSNHTEPNKFGSNDDSSVLHRSSFASSNQLTETNRDSFVIETQYRPPSLASDQIKGQLNIAANTNAKKFKKVDDKIDHESEDKAFEESHYSEDPSSKLTNEAENKVNESPVQSRNDLGSEEDLNKYQDLNNPAKQTIIRKVLQNVINNNSQNDKNGGPQEPIYIHTREIIEIHHEHDEDPDHKCPYCDHGPVEKPKGHYMEDDDIIGLHNDLSSQVTSSLSSSQFGESQQSFEHPRLPGMQQDQHNQFNYNQVHFSHGPEHDVDLPDEEEKMANDLSQDGLPIVELKFDEQSSINNPPFGKSFISSNMGRSVLAKDRQPPSNNKSSKMQINQQTGMPIIAKPTRITILGDVPKEIKLPTDEPKKNTTNIGNVWQRAMMNEPKQIVQEEMSFDEDSQILSNSVDARHLAEITDGEEEQKGRIRDSAASSNFIPGPSDSESIDMKRNIRVHGESQSSEAFSRVNRIEQVKNSLDSDVSNLTDDVEKRFRKVQKELDLPNENMPKEYPFKDQNYDSSHDFSNSQQPETSWDEIKILNDELGTPKNQGSSFK